MLILTTILHYKINPTRQEITLVQINIIQLSTSTLRLNLYPRREFKLTRVVKEVPKHKPSLRYITTLFHNKTHKIIMI